MATNNEIDRIDAALETVDAGKRGTLRKIVIGTAFVAPVVASFAINAMMVTPAMAINISNSTVSNV